MANRPVQKETSSQQHFLQFNNLACETAGGKVKINNILSLYIYSDIPRLRLLTEIDEQTTNIVIKGDFCHGWVVCSC